MPLPKFGYNSMLLKEAGFEPAKIQLSIDLQSSTFNHSAILSIMQNRDYRTNFFDIIFWYNEDLVTLVTKEVVNNEILNLPLKTSDKVLIENFK